MKKEERQGAKQGISAGMETAAKWAVRIAAFMFLLQWMVRVTVGEEYDIAPQSSLMQAFSALPFMIFGGLYGYFVAFLVFLALFLTEMVLDLQQAYVMSVYLVGMYIYAMMGQYRTFRLKRKTALWSVVAVILLSITQFLCRDIFAAYNFSSFEASKLVMHQLNASANVLAASAFFYLLYNKAPDGIKGYFPIGVGYTRKYIENLLLQNDLRKTRVSRKVTAILIGLIVILGFFSSTFSQMILPDMQMMQDHRGAVVISPDASSEDRVQETAAAGGVDETGMSADAPSEDRLQEITAAGGVDEADAATDGADAGENVKLADFMRSNYGYAFVVKLLLMNLCLGVPLVGIANFYTKVSVGAPIGKLSTYLFGFMDVPEGERAGYANDLGRLRPNTHDEITDLYYATEIMMSDVIGYIERLQEEQRLEEDLRVAQAASEAKSSFLSNMSHEIRTPINAVLGMDEMILRECDDREILRYAADIKSAGNTLLSLVNDILDFSKIEAGKMDILPVQYQTGSTVNDLVNMLSQKAADKGLELILHIDENLPTMLYGDEIRIKQCVTNILTNAVKYTEKGSVTLEMGYEKVDESHIQLKVRVVDTGIGIKEEDLGKLFSPFERIEEIRNRTIEGTGLGMSIVKKLLAMMDTKMVVKSEYGKGSDFSFDVLQEVVDWTPIGDFAQAYRKAVDSMEKYQESFHAPEARVLIVDDTRMNLTVIRSLLKATQLQVETAESGRETLEKVCGRHYDMIFLDHRMPEMDGIETFQAMQALEGNLNRDTPCVALTANAVAGAREEYMRIGFCDYLSKPVESVKLEKMLIRYLPQEKVIRPGTQRWQETERTHTQDALGGGEGMPEAQGDSAGRFTGITGIDLGEAIKNCGGEDILEEVLKDFLLSIPEKSEKIESYAAEGDYRNYTVLVHALKSSARLIGAMQLSADAADLEQRGNEEDAEAIAAKTPALLELYRSYLEHLAPIAPPEDDSDKPEISEEELAGAYADLRELIEAYDYDSAEMIMQMLAEYRIPDAQREKHGKIRKLLASVDREGLLEAL